MAIYSTFFVCKPDELLSAFLGWKLPLPEPVRREVTNPFTRKIVTIESRCPDWPNAATEDESGCDRKIVSIQGRYEDYLEGRPPSSVRERPHACLKNITQLELNPLGEAADMERAVDDALYSPPHVSAMLQQLCPERSCPFSETGAVSFCRIC